MLEVTYISLVRDTFKSFIFKLMIFHVDIHVRNWLVSSYMHTYEGEGVRRKPHLLDWYYTSSFWR